MNHICDKCGCLLSERVVNEIQRQEFVQRQSEAGKSRSEAKSEAARANGKKGGRPRTKNPLTDG